MLGEERKNITYNIQGQLITLILSTVIILIAIGVYYFLQKKQDITKSERKGYVLFVDSFVKSIEDLVVDVMGIKLKWFTPYAIYLLLYIGSGVLLGVTGLEAPLTSYTVAFMLGFVTFIGIFVSGITFQKLRFFKKYLLNPTEIITQFSPLISITFRIFGNLTAGTVILTLLYALTGNIIHNVPIVGYVNILGGFVAPVLHFYFDIFDGLVQTYIFTLLTLAYIGLEVQHEDVKKPKYAKRRITFIKGKKGKIIDDNIDLVRQVN